MFWSKKDCVEQLFRIDLKDLKPHLKAPYSSLIISYESNKLVLDLFPDDKEARFDYFQTINEVQRDFKYTIKLETTNCNFGNKRYWFKCLNCNHRVRILYYREDYFLCRHCLNLSYLSKQETKSRMPEMRLIKHLLKTEDRIARLLPIKKLFYKGKPTKKYIKYMRLKATTDVLFNC